MSRISGLSRDEKVALGVPLPEPQAGFVRRGGSADAQSWWDAVNRRCRAGVCPSGWFEMHVNVSRAALHKALRSGRVTQYVFVQNGFRPKILLPVNELKLWADKGNHSHLVVPKRKRARG